jgi:hypothetical protein
VQPAEQLGVTQPTGVGARWSACAVALVLLVWLAPPAAGAVAADDAVVSPTDTGAATGQTAPPDALPGAAPEPEAPEPVPSPELETSSEPETFLDPEPGPEPEPQPSPQPEPVESDVTGEESAAEAQPDGTSTAAPSTPTAPDVASAHAGGLDRQSDVQREQAISPNEAGEQPVPAGVAPVSVLSPLPAKVEAPPRGGGSVRAGRSDHLRLAAMALWRPRSLIPVGAGRALSTSVRLGPLPSPTPHSPREDSPAAGSTAASPSPAPVESPTPRMPSTPSGSGCAGSSACGPTLPWTCLLLAALGCLCALLYERLVEAMAVGRPDQFVSLRERPG